MSETIQNLNKLPVDTIRLLSSTQVITSVSSTVKELFENSLDAGSLSVQVKLENFGLDLIEVKDDGVGISGENVYKMFLPGYTSKITDFKDLDELATYGFRGAALAALCSLADVTITTKTEKDALAMTYVINKTGMPVSSTPSHLPKGTIISVKNLFKALPVRKQFASSKRKMEEELKRVENVVKALAVIHNQLRVALVHNKNTIWQKNAVNGIKQSFMQVFGLRAVSKMELITEKQENMSLELIVPKKGVEDAQSLFLSMPNNFLFINKRPVFCKEITKKIEKTVGEFYEQTDKHVMFLASFSMPPCEIDINLEPNKTKALLKNQTEVMALLKKCLETYYGEIVSSEITITESEPEETPSKRLKFDESFLIQEKPKTATVCSEINKNNCVLASEQEITILTEKLHNNPLNIDAGFQVHRDDIQERPILAKHEIFNKTLTSIENSKKEPELSSLDWSKGTEKLNNNPLNIDAGFQVHCDDIQERPISDTQEFFNKVLTSMNNSKKKPGLSILDWSRGTVPNNNGGLLNTGAKIVVNENLPETPERISLEKKVIEQSIPVLKESPKLPVSSQMRKKEMNGFNKFSKIMRPKIIAEQPNIVFTQIGAILSERWKELSSDEKEYYESVAKAIEERPQTPILPKRPIVQKRPERREIAISTSLDQIKKLLEKPSKSFNSSIRLVGQLQPNNEWIYVNNSEIGLLNVERLSEMVTYQKMMKNFKMPSQELSHKIPILENLDIFKNLVTEHDCQKLVNRVTSPVIEKNGFGVEIKNTANDIQAMLTHIPAGIDSNLDDLNETLDLYKKLGKNASLCDLRPKKVKSFIMNQAKKSTGKPNRGITASLLETYRSSFSDLPSRDFKNNEIFIPFYNLCI